MTEKELLELRDLAEQGKVQFKERALDKNDISAEMSAFANKKGGRLIIGIKDKTGEIHCHTRRCRKPQTFCPALHRIA